MFVPDAKVSEKLMGISFKLAVQNIFLKNDPFIS